MRKCENEKMRKREEGKKGKRASISSIIIHIQILTQAPISMLHDMIQTTRDKLQATSYKLQATSYITNHITNHITISSYRPYRPFDHDDDRTVSPLRISATHFSIRASHQVPDLRPWTNVTHASRQTIQREAFSHLAFPIIAHSHPVSTRSARLDSNPNRSEPDGWCSCPALPGSPGSPGSSASCFALKMNRRADEQEGYKEAWQGHDESRQ